MQLIVDANILVGEILRKRGQQLLRNPQLELHITEKALSETNHELAKRLRIIARDENMIANMLGILSQGALEIIATINTIPESECGIQNAAMFEV
ncbi:MAG: hypothetical protein HC933_19665 [Pleurocapsa sp. SU_196_0]|nr:hypothetical protein [Pleurocapsa sp. SU_196_0]